MKQPNHHPFQLTAEEQAHVSAARQGILALIRENGGWLPFPDYANTCLNHPGFGYYGNWIRSIGPEGDFITAPEMGSLFNDVMGTCLARTAERNGGGFLEIGAGMGTFAANVLRIAQKDEVSLKNYWIIETSTSLRSLQQDTLRNLDGTADIRWLEEFPSKFTGVVFGNELIDAIPCSIYQYMDSSWHERGVSEEDGNLVWCNREIRDDEVPNRLKSLSVGEGYCAEINFRGESLVRSILDAINKGILVLVDYGYGRTEFYHPQRILGTLMCHRRHVAFSDPFMLPGISDMTTHVDFTGVADAAAQSGGTVLGYCDLSDFLTSCGSLKDMDPETDPVRFRSQVESMRKLLMPHEMGQIFKVMVIGKGDCQAPVMGCRMRPL